jgi:hypothetical protein
MLLEALWEIGKQIREYLSFASLGPEDLCKHHPLRRGVHGLHII